jgi:hypothetical protein
VSRRGKSGRDWRGWGGFLVTSPHETSTLVVSYWMHVKEFILQVVEVVVIEVEASFQRTIGDPSLAFEKINDLGENVIEGHSRPSTALASAVLYP